MLNIHNTENSLVLRTDFSDEEAWNSVCSSIKRPVGEFQAYVGFLSYSEYEGLTAKQIVQLLPKSFDRSFIFIVDEMTISHVEHPVLVIDLLDEPGRTFRVIPSEMYSVENNLSVSNMDFSEFADEVDKNGIFRGFSDII